MKLIKTHKEQLCPGQFDLTQILAIMGGVVQAWTVQGWRCPICGRESQDYTPHHVAKRKEQL